MSNIVLFHPAGLGDCILDIPILFQLISSNSLSNSYIYVCNISARPIIELSGINQHINILYLQWPKLNIRDLFSLLELRREKQKIFVLSGMNLKRVGYLKYLCSNETEFYGTMENYPNEMMDRIRPKDSTYKYIEKPKEKCHRIVQNCKLFKSQGLVDNVDFSIKRLNENIDPNFVSINLGLKREPYIVIHTSQVGIDAKKTMHIHHWRNIIDALTKQIDKKIIIIGTSRERMNVEEIINSIDKDKIINACGKTDLYEVIYIIYHSKMVLAVDGGMAHLAAYLGKKLITIFGPTNHFNVSPIGTKGMILSNQVECSPCYETKIYFNCPYDRKCLNSLDPEVLVRCITELIYNDIVIESNIPGIQITEIPTLETLKKQLV